MILSIIILIVIFIIVSVLCFIFKPNTPEFWTALGSMATLIAIVIALFYQPIKDHIERPIIKISLQKDKPPYVRIIYDSGVPIIFLTLSIKNEGKKIAEKSKHFISNIATYENEKWNIQADWVPVPLFLLRGQTTKLLSNSRNINVIPAAIPVDQSEKKSIRSYLLTNVYDPDSGFAGEFDLIPNRPYLFDLGQFGLKGYENSFKISWADIFKNQIESYPNDKKYCFEITIYAKDIEPKSAYVIFKWNGNFSDKTEEINERLNVELIEKCPW